MKRTGVLLATVLGEGEESESQEEVMDDEKAKGLVKKNAKALKLAQAKQRERDSRYVSHFQYVEIWLYLLSLYRSYLRQC